MLSTIIDFLNRNVDGGDILVGAFFAYIVWYILWKLIIYRFLEKQDYSSIWHELSDLGPLATFGILVFLFVPVILVIASIQAVFIFGAKIFLPIVVFWGVIIFVLYYIIKNIKKKK